MSYSYIEIWDMLFSHFDIKTNPDVKICLILIFSTVLLLMKMMVEYCQCVDDIPSAAPDLLTRLVDLLKVGFIFI